MGLRSFAADLLPQPLQAGWRTIKPSAPLDEPSSFAALQTRLDYLSKSELQLVREAYKFADAAHLGQFRASGEPYITHPIAVAGLCAAWRLDAQAIMAALMHDAMEDCGVTKPELIERFGAPTAELVDGLTKLDKLQFSTREESQAESFRKMLLAMTRDVRVILVKLADRLHNMRTMGAMAANKRGRIARETLDIYAPIAHRLGLNGVYRELQEHCFAYLHPWRQGALAKAVQRSRGYRRDIVHRVQADAQKAFVSSRVKVTIAGREKTVYSIYRKMREKHASFAEVNDLFGFRVVVPTISDCYLALGVLHQLYKPVPGRFKDYIAIPKANGYQSLHTTLVSPLGTAVEFQIRTEAMDAVAESGIAAHWMYKGKQTAAGDPQQLGAMWLKSLIDIQDDTRDPAEFLEHVKIDLAPDSVYVFTPKSRILALPKGATPVDFAYAIHSNVGDRCVGALVNGEPVALSTALRSGDVVQISTAPTAQPHPSWMQFVRTGRARSKIRHFLKTQELEESHRLGERLLAQALRAEGFDWPETQDGMETASDGTHSTAAPMDASAWASLVKWAGSRSRMELLQDLGTGRKIATIVAKQMARLLVERGHRPDAITLSMGHFSGQGAGMTGRGVVQLDGSEGASVKYAICCRPVPGDALAGYLGRGEGLTVHTAECGVARKLGRRDSEHWMGVEWAEEPTRPFECGVHALLRNGKGVLAQVAQAVALAEADITHIAMGDERIGDTVPLDLLLSVRDRQHLADVLRRLRRSPPVLRVSRVKP